MEGKGEGKGEGKNRMGRPAGSGTVSHKRRQAYRERQARREDWNSGGWRNPSQERADAEKAKEEEKKRKKEEEEEEYRKRVASLAQREAALAEREAAFAKKVDGTVKVEEEKKDEAFDKKEAEAAPGAPQEKKNDEKDEAFVKKEAEAAPEAAEKSAVDVKKEAGTETPATEAAGTGASDGPKEDEKKEEKEAAFVKKALGPSDEQRKKEEEAALAKDLQKDWQSWKEKTFGKKASEDMADEKAPKAWEHKSHQQWVKKTYKEALTSDKEASSSSKRKDPPTPSPDFGGSSPEPSSAEPYDSLDKRDEQEASLDKREKKKLPLPEWVAVDWYRTIELSNGHLQKGALRALKDAGVRVWVLSYCGLDRSQEV